MTNRIYLRDVRLLLFALLIVASPLFAQRYSYRQYGPSQGLTDLSITCLLQDRTGYIWAGTPNGLFRYDGTAFRKFDRADGLPGSEILGLAEAPDGALWIATFSGVARMAGLRFDTVDTGATGPVLSVQFDRQGRVHLTYHSGILRGTPAGGSGYHFSTVVPGPTGPMFAKGDDIWFGKGGGLWHLNGDVAQPVGSLPDLPRDKWVPVLDKLGNLWARSTTLLYELPQGRAHFVNRSEQIGGTGRQSIYAGPDGVYVSTRFGVAIVSGSTKTYLDRQHGLPMDDVGAVLVDRDGSLWVGLQGGGLVRRLGHGEWLSWTKEDGLRQSGVLEVLHDPNGFVWVGTGAGLSLIDPSGNTVLRRPATAKAFMNATQSIVRSPSGDIFVGTDNQSVDRFSPKGVLVRTYGLPSGLRIDRIHAMTFDREGRLWVVGYPTCLRSRQPVGRSGVVEFDVVDVPGIAYPQAQDSLVDESGNVWIAFNSGLARFDGSRWRIFDQRDGLKADAVETITSKNGELWIGYHDALGLSRMRLNADHAVITHFDRSNGLTSDKVYTVAIDSHARVWVSTDNGIDVLDGSSWNHFSTEDGLAWDDAGAITADHDGTVWVATSGGLSRFTPVRSSEDLKPAILTSIQGLSREWLATDKPTLPYARSSLVVHFSDLDYSAESSMQFRYRIVGYDKAWHETQERVVHLDRLPAGSYRLEVEAARRTGVWITPAATFSFHVTPAWWQSWWFLSLCLICFGLFAGGVWRLRVRTLKAQKESLEILVERRSSQLRESNHQLEQIAHYDMLTTLPNRRRFNDDLKQRIARGRSTAQFSLLLIDLDRFKQINDTFGHDAGDAVLVETACRLRTAVRDRDCVVRLGGDEFAVLIDLDEGKVSLVDICDRIIAALTKDVVFGSHRLRVGCSIGVATFPGDGEMQETLFKSADLALYQSKREGRGLYRFFSPEIQDDLVQHTHPVDESL
jgi:diguanylate cyclase (GGDEF)-like protein